MKYVLIHGQDHQGTSCHMGRMLAERLLPAQRQAGAERLAEFFLPRDLPEFCRGCYTCLNKGLDQCPHAAYLQPITQAILEADLLIFTTPVYCMRASGSMKALLDHLFTWWLAHRPRTELFSKKAVVLSAGAGAGMASAAKDIRVSLDNWGVAKVYTYGTTSTATSWREVPEEKKAKLSRDLAALAAKISRRRDREQPSTAGRARFRLFRFMHRREWDAPVDRAYWREKGWLSRERPWKAPDQTEGGQKK